MLVTRLLLDPSDSVVTYKEVFNKAITINYHKMWVSGIDVYFRDAIEITGMDETIYQWKIEVSSALGQ